MATITDVASLASALPGVTEGDRHGNLTWFVEGKAFAWERPFSKPDIRRYGAETPPEGTIVAIRVADLSDKEAILSRRSTGFFTIPHFDGYSAILVQLETVSRKALREAIIDGWLARAPSHLARRYLEGGGQPAR